MKRVKKGMTLLEVVIALGIIGIMLLPLANGMLTSVRANKKAENTQTAKLLGQQVIEKLKIQDRIENNASINFHSQALEITNSGTDKIYNLSSTGEINGFEINGVIKESTTVTDVNDSNYGNPTLGLNPKIGALLVVTKNASNKIEFQFLEGTLAQNDIENMIKSNYKLTQTMIDDVANINVNISDRGIVTVVDRDKPAKELFKGTKKLDGALTIYIEDVSFKSEINGSDTAIKPTVNIKVNNNGLTQLELQVLRDIKLERENYEKGFSLDKDGSIKTFSNIIYDVNNKRIGLYTAKLDILKNGKVIETVEAEFYIGE
ncbi:MAG: prepilin-type N-terminal cleavage/methylation domain-containing protein [Sarcina sp.]